jgi:uncharacterized protein
MMGLREQLSNDLKDAMRQRQETRKRTLRSVIAALKQAETELDSSGERIHLDDEGILALIVQQAKQRRDSIREYAKGGRQDLVDEEQAELAILEEYMPRQLTRAEIEAEARQVIEEVGASGPRDIGKVMRPLLDRLGDRADGREVNLVVRELLAD